MAGATSGSRARIVPARALLLALLALFVALPGIDRLPPLDRDESRYVQATKQMAETGDYVDIRFQDQARYKKPIGIYWLQSAMVTLSGEGADAPLWVYRLVSVAGALAAVLALYWVGAALFGAQAGLLGAIALAASFGLAFEGRIAKTDATLLVFVILAQAALARIYVACRQGEAVPRAMPWLFWVAQGCGILVKGPIAPLVSALTIAGLLLARRGDWRWLGSLRPGRGLLLAAVICLPWLIAISWKSGFAFWQESVGKDLLGKVVEGQESHGAPPGYYLLTGGLYLWPVVLVAVSAMLRAWNRAAQDPRLLFMLAWFVPVWLFFELLPTKLPHYVLPAYPALALLAGWALALPADERSAPLRRWQVWLLGVGHFGHAAVTLLLAAAMAGLPFWMEGRVSPWGIAAAFFALAAGWLAFAPGGLPTPRRLAGAALCAGVVYALAALEVVPSLHTIWLSPRIAEAVEQYRPCEVSPFASAGYHEPSLVFLAGTGTLLTGPEGAAQHLLANPACGLALVPADEAGSFAAALSAAGRAPLALTTIDGLNYSNGRTLSLTLYGLEP